MRKIVGDEKEVSVSVDGKWVCQECGKPGMPRTDNNLPAGVHCNLCWDEIVRKARSKSW